MGCIYVIRNKINNMKYVGKTKNFKRRMKEYKYKSNVLDKHTNYKIMQEINKYGFNNFEMFIIEDNIQDEMLNEREIFWIEYLQTRNPSIGYNSKKGGDGGEMINESKKKMSESSKYFRHSYEEKLKRSKPIFVIDMKNNKLIPYISAKVYGDYLNIDRSIISRAIKKGNKTHGVYIFYQDPILRINAFNKILDRKSHSNNKKALQSLLEYIFIYEKFFPNDKNSVENIEKIN